MTIRELAASIALHVVEFVICGIMDMHEKHNLKHEHILESKALRQQQQQLTSISLKGNIYSKGTGLYFPF